MPIVQVVLDQHAEEAALLWLRRDDAVCQWHLKLEDLAVLDRQLDGQLDGLLVAEAESPGLGWSICEREMNCGEPGEVFSAAVMALQTGLRDRIQCVLETGHASPENSRSLVSAFGWLPYRIVAEHIDRLLMSADASRRGTGISAAVAHRTDPGIHLIAALEHSDDILSAQALRAAGELGRTDLLPALRDQLAASDLHRRASAAWSICRLTGDEQVVEILQQVVQRRSANAERALQIISRVTTPKTATSWTAQLFNHQQTSRLGVQGMGATGLPSAIPELLDLMNAPALARIAGEAFSMITGIDLFENLSGIGPESFEAGPNDDPADGNVEMDPDENLPWPNRQAVADWWVKHRDEFRRGVRYMLGRPITEQWMQHVLCHGYQRQRAAAALELAIMSPETPLFNVKAPGYRQQELLGLKQTRG